MATGAANHVSGCVSDGRCWNDDDGTEWHPGHSTGVYRVLRVKPTPPSEYLKCDFIRDDQIGGFGG